MLGKIFNFKSKSEGAELAASMEQVGYSNGLLAGYCTETGKEIYLDYDKLMSHASICGATGSGESIIRNSLVKQQMSNGGGLLFIDGVLSYTERETMYQSGCSTGRENDFIIIDLTNQDSANTENLELYMEEWILQNKIIYVRLPAPHDNKEASSLAKLIIANFRSAIAQLQQRLSENPLTPPFMLFPNQCSTYIDSSWIRMFGQGHLLRFFITPMFQTLECLKMDGGDALQDIVMGNTYYKFFLKQETTESATQVANQLGMKSIYGSDETHIIQPEQIQSIPVGECLLLVGNKELYRLRLPTP